MFKVVVPIKQVEALDDEFELEPGSANVDPDFVDRDLNDWDTFSVEAAVAIKEALGDAEVVVVTVGDEESEEALVDCLARGADRAIRIDSEDGSPDPLEVASVLAAATEPEQPDLVLCGVQSSDAASSATGIALAAYLDLPHAAVVRGIELRAEEGQIRVERELEGGLLQELSLPLPCLLTVQTGANEPRYASLRAIKQASDKPLNAVGLADIGLEPAALAERRGAGVAELSTPPKGQGAQLLEGGADQIADEIIAILRDQAGVMKGGSG